MRDMEAAERAKNVHLQVTSKWGLQVPSKIKDPRAPLLPRGRTPTALENPPMAEQPHSHRETWLPTCFRGGWSEDGTWVPSLERQAVGVASTS